MNKKQKRTINIWSVKSLKFRLILIYSTVSFKSLIVTKWKRSNFLKERQLEHKYSISLDKCRQRLINFIDVNYGAY